MKASQQSIMAAKAFFCYKRTSCKFCLRGFRAFKKLSGEQQVKNEVSQNLGTFEILNFHSMLQRISSLSSQLLMGGTSYGTPCITACHYFK